MSDDNVPDSGQIWRAEKKAELLLEAILDLTKELRLHREVDGTSFSAGFEDARMRILAMLEGPPQLGSIRHAIQSLKPADPT